MRKLGGVFLTILIIFSLFACQKQSDEPNDTSATEGKTEVEESVTDADTGKEPADPGVDVNNEILEQYEKLAQERRDAVLSAKPDLTKITGNTYYVSNSGNDNNDGKTPETAWATVGKLSILNFQPGDAVLFECGGEWNMATTLPAKSGVTYASYGEGNKPVLNGATRNSADKSYWVETSIPNVYQYQYTLNGCGVIALIDGNGEIHTPTKVCGTDKTQEALKGDLEFVFVFQAQSTDRGTLYLYSSKGNPGSRFKEIYIGEKRNIISLSDHVTVDGLEFRFTGAHGVGGSSGNNGVTVRNCVFSYIGGSMMGDHTTPYGNAVEIYGECSDFTVENNWIYQIYDTGITFQCGSQYNGDCNYKDIKIQGNLVEYCYWSIEFFNQPVAGRTRTTRNVDISDNFCRYSGMGWGTTYRSVKHGFVTDNNTKPNHICSWGLDADVSNFVIHDNIFEICVGEILRVAYTLTYDVYTPGDSKIQMSKNTYIDYEGAYLLRYHAMAYAYSELADQLLIQLLNETDPVIICLGRKT